jgi:hypothetical protein
MRARANMLAEERRADRPNILKGTMSPLGTWSPKTTMKGRGGNYGIR